MPVSCVVGLTALHCHPDRVHINMLFQQVFIPYLIQRRDMGHVHLQNSMLQPPKKSILTRQFREAVVSNASNTISRTTPALRRI